MGGRYNKLCDRKGQDPKMVRQANKPTKGSLNLTVKELSRHLKSDLFKAFHEFIVFSGFPLV